MAITLKEEKIIDRWSVLIERAEGKGNEIFEKTKARLQKVEAPNIIVKSQEVRPTLFGGLVYRKQRPFLTVTNKYLRGYTMLIGARDYGKQLSTFWYLVMEPKGLLKLLHILGNPKLLILTFPIVVPLFLYQRIFKRKKSVLPDDLDVFDLEELTCYATTGHHAVLETVEELMSGLGQDPSKIDRKSRGFLGVS